MEVTEKLDTLFWLLTLKHQTNGEVIYKNHKFSYGIPLGQSMRKFEEETGYDIIRMRLTGMRWSPTSGIHELYQRGLE